MHWQSKVDASKTKHGFYKRNSKADPEDTIKDCLLSRVLNTHDMLEGKIVTERTPKSKIIAYKASSTERTGKKYYYTVSRVLGLEGQAPTGTVMGNDLHSYLRNNQVNKPPLSGTFDALVDSVLIGRWDLKSPNLSAPNVRNFDMDFALNDETDTYSKVWNKKDFKSLVTGGASGQNKKPSKHKVGTVDAIASAFTQTIADFGSRANEYYIGTNPIYTEQQKGYRNQDFSTISKAIKQDIKNHAKGEEPPTRTVLRVFKERAQGLRESLSTRVKNPRDEVLAEMQRVGAPQEHQALLLNQERKLVQSLDKIERFVDELSNGELMGVYPVGVIRNKRRREKDADMHSCKKAKAGSSDGEAVEMFGMKFQSLGVKDSEQNKSSSASSEGELSAPEGKRSGAGSSDEDAVEMFGMSFHPVDKQDNQNRRIAGAARGAR